MTEMWHFIADNKLRDGSEPAPVGGMERWDGPVVLCGSGLHACPRALDALKYAPSGAPSGTIQVRLVLLSGIVLADDDKAAASERHILASADCTRELHEFALWCAESVRHLMVDSRSTTALTVKRSWLDGQATDGELAAARDAGWAAAEAAAGAAAGAAAWAAAGTAAWAAARDAAEAAAGAAVWAAGWGAARDAGWAAARAAARDAAGAAQNADLERRLREKLGGEVRGRSTTPR
ncbi:MAG: hypothetical protein BroJett042_31640 [Bacteroidota bacterium]|nr:MAG: hypothetical protein BroJett042_31640 [Bacteroidota bacterium]